MKKFLYNKTAYIDLDGTIIDVFDRYYSIINDYIKCKYNMVSIDYNAYKKKKRKRYKDHIIVKDLLDIDIDINNYYEYKMKQIENPNRLSKDKLINKAREAICILRKRGYQIELISVRNNKKTAFEQIEKLNIDGYFDNISFLSSESENSKLKYLWDRGVFVDDIIIGDGKLEMDCAIELGIRGFHVDTGLYEHDLFQEPITKTNNIFEVLYYL